MSDEYYNDNRLILLGLLKHIEIKWDDNTHYVMHQLWLLVFVATFNDFCISAPLWARVYNWSSFSLHFSFCLLHTFNIQIFLYSNRNQFKFLRSRFEMLINDMFYLRNDHHLLFNRIKTAHLIIQFFTSWNDEKKKRKQINCKEWKK